MPGAKSPLLKEWAKLLQVRGDQRLAIFVGDKRELRREIAATLGSKSARQRRDAIGEGSDACSTLSGAPVGSFGMEEVILQSRWSASAVRERSQVLQITHDSCPPEVQ